MARVDTAGLDAFRARLKAAAEGGEAQRFLEECTREMAARLLAGVIKNTPVGEGTFEVVTAKERKAVKAAGGKIGRLSTRDGNGRISKLAAKKDDRLQLRRLTNGGTLRRGWTTKTQGEAENGGQTSPSEWVKGLTVKHSGREYSIVVTNCVRYASYVEYGHRQNVGQYVPTLGKRLVNSWVPGQFMLKKANEQLTAGAARILNGKLEKWLRGLADGK